MGRAAVAWVIAQAVPALLFCARPRRAAHGFGRPDLRLLAETAALTALRAWLGGLAHLLNARVDQVLLGLLASQAALGTYAVAVNASEILFYLPSAVATALLPGGGAERRGAGVERTLRVFRVGDDRHACPP